MSQHEEDQTFVDNHPLPSHIVQKMTSSSSRKRGWAGEDMEINHQYNYNIEKHQDKSIATAVDLSQFRNSQVGKGYQSKGVIRQRTIGNTEDGDAIEVLDMTKKKGASNEKNSDKKYFLEETSSRRKKRKKSKKKKDKRKNKVLEEDNNEVEKYLQCEGVRMFRKEIEKIYVEATQTSAKLKE